MNKISVFDKLATRSTVENTNGIVLDSILLSADVEEDLEKDSYILTAEFSTLDNLYKEIKEKSILKVLLDYGYDYFVVKNIDYDEFNKSIDVIARHITEEAMLGLWINNIAPTNLTVKDAIQWIYDRAIGTKEITFVSDITETMSADYVRMNMQEMLYNTTNGMLTKKATGEVLRRGYTVYIKNKIKFENDLEIRKGKNLTGFSGQEDCSNVVTRVNPISYNAPVTDVYVTSPLANKYKSIITKEIKYDNVRLASDVQDTDENKDNYIICDNEESLRAKLIELATKEFTENEIDKALCEYDISFEDLSTTEEYKDYQQLESASTGEVVKVVVDGLDYTLNARIIKKKYDVANQKIVSCTLSNVNKNVKPQGFYEVIISTSNQLEEESTLLKNITDGDYILAEKIKGYLNSKNVSIRASRKVADKQDYIVAISECLDKDSPLYGAIMWGTGGIYLSTQRTADGKDWDWSTAITSKGITADVIDTGTLRAITITNADGSFVMDLGSDKGLEFFINNKKSMIIDKSEITFYDNEGNRQIGGLMSTNRTGDKTKKSMVLGHRDNSLLCIDYYNPEDKLWYNYIKFDKYDQEQGFGYPISFYENTDFFGNVCHYKPLEMRKPITFYNHAGNTQVGKIFQSSDNNMIIGCDTGNSLRLCYKKDDAYYNAIKIHRDDNANGGNFLDLYGVTTIYNDLTVKGTKNRAVETENYGTRLLNAYETSECYFGDLGKASTGEDCKVRIDLDPIFLETVNTKLPYHVFLSKYGKGDIWVSELHETYFIVESENPNLEFSFEIKVKQKDYTDTRLEEFKDNNTEKGDKTIED